MLDDVVELLGPVSVFLPFAVAVGRLHDQVVGAFDRSGTGEQSRPLHPQVAGEHEPSLGVAITEPELQDGRPEDVTGGNEPHGAGAVQVVGATQRHRHELAEQRHRVLFGVERRHPAGVLLPFLQPPDLPARILFLDAAGIGEHDLQQLGRGRRGEDRAPIARLAEQRQPTGVVDVRVAQDHPVQRARVERERLAVPLVSLAAALDQPAVQQDAGVVGFDEMARPGDLTGCAVERKTNHGMGVYVGCGGGQGRARRNRFTIWS